MNDWMSVLLIAIFMFVAGLVLGLAGARVEVAKDCSTLGSFRSGDVAYVCSPKAKA
jgi:hypothetical protein